ncbi:MAG TPA: septal ring lytic transglycosylase RlpA family protein [Candidatus Obscuribacterales bacterium]
MRKLVLVLCTVFSANAWSHGIAAAETGSAQPRGLVEIAGAPPKAKAVKARRFSGNVSWYGPQFHGKRTASGEIFDMNKLTAAHRTLPFGTRVLVENPRTGQSVVVKVNDRGPYVPGRVMDISRESARRVGILLGGVAFMNCLVLEEDDDDQPAERSRTSGWDAVLPVADWCPIE